MKSLFLDVLPHFLYIYAFIYVITGSFLFSLSICTGLAIALLKYKLPQAPQTYCEELLSGETPHIIAHKGAALDAPENTLGAIRLAKQNGATMIEFDVGYTSDGVAVVIHDDEVDRTTDGSGLVSQMSLDRLQQLNASAHHPNKAEFPEEKVPTLDEVIRLCLDLGLKMLIDVKGNAKLTADKMCEMYQKFPTLYKHAAVCSFYPDVVYMVKQRDHDIITGLTHRTHYVSREGDGSWREGPWWYKLVTPVLDLILYWAQYHWLWLLCGNNLFLLLNKDVSRTLVEKFSARGIQCVVWTVNNPKEKIYMKDVLRVAHMTDTLVD